MLIVKGSSGRIETLTGVNVARVSDQRCDIGMIASIAEQKANAAGTQARVRFYKRSWPDNLLLEKTPVETTQSARGEMSPLSVKQRWSMSLGASHWLQIPRGKFSQWGVQMTPNSPECHPLLMIGSWTCPLSLPASVLFTRSPSRKPAADAGGEASLLVWMAALGSLRASETFRGRARVVYTRAGSSTVSSV